MDFKILDWDSRVFEIPTAVLTLPPGSLDRIEEVLDALRKADVRLAYYFSQKEIGDIASKQGGIFVDQKTVFFASEKDFPIESTGAIDALTSFSKEKDLSSMEELALQAGEFSRFKVDPKFPVDKFELLYKTWIRRSIKKEIADDVLVIYHDAELAGFVTLSIKDGAGEIGLIAVERRFRKQRLGQRLVLGALDWCRMNNLSGCRVVTQGRNLAACQLYEKNGFSVQQIDHVYHFWL